MDKNDYIKREDAITALCDLRKGFRHIKEICAVGACIVEIKDCVPSAPTSKVGLNPLARLELEKAMLGRGVDYETIQLILLDFDIRIRYLNER